jgi:2',3'-cyclic-nucleotide 2'-phosphodiesterase (5'-nucleotidase family)
LLTLLHTNDFHNHFTSAQSERLQKLKAEVEGDVLLLDAGDAVSCGNITYHPGGEPILDLMNAAGYDALTVGNREFHVTDAGFRTTLNRAKFPILCANIAVHQPFWGNRKQELPCQPFVLFALKEWTVAVMGLTVPMVTPTMAVRKLSSFVFAPIIDTARAQIEAIRANSSPDLIVALTHIGYTQDKKLAESVAEIDLIIGGHSHTTLETGERVGNTLIVQTGCYGKSVGRVVVARTAEGSLEMKAGLEPL